MASTRIGRRKVSVMEALDRRLLLTTYFVDADALPGGNGATWGSAFQSPQAALAIAVAGDEIHIANGIYKATDVNDRNATFALKSGVKVLGGYAGLGDDVDPDHRDPVDHPTILSGEIGSTTSNFDNSFHVVTANAVDSAALLDGVTITKGSAQGGMVAGTEYGGGIVMTGASPTINNCIITANLATSFGDGMMVRAGSAPLITNCVFSNNGVVGMGNNGGAAIRIESSSATITNCTFSGNAAYMGAGAIEISASSLTISGCTFAGNWSRYGGGAISIWGETSQLLISDCAFTGNTSQFSGTLSAGSKSVSIVRDCSFTQNSAAYGGGIASYDCTVTVERCSFVRNTAIWSGGGIRNELATLTVSNSRFLGNSVTSSAMDQGGGAVFTRQRIVTLINCELIGNSAPRGGGLLEISTNGSIIRNCAILANSATSGGGIESTGLAAHVLNCIVRGNTATTGPQIMHPSGLLDVRYTNAQGGFTGTGNIDADPQFVRAPHSGGDNAWGTADDDYGDLRLQLISPCIDAGNNLHVPVTNTQDLNGQPRLFDFPGANDPGAIVDMGAHELGMRLGLLKVNAGQTLSLPAGGHTFIAEQLAIAAGGALDLVDDSLVLEYSGASPLGSWNGSNYTGVTGMIAAGQLFTSLSNAGAGVRTLGVGDDGDSVLVKYTYAGDLDLDGDVDGDDYFIIDAHVAQSGVVFGYGVGDIDLDGDIDGDDYFWLDNNVPAQETQLY